MRSCLRWNRGLERCFAELPLCQGILNERYQREQALSILQCAIVSMLIVLLFGELSGKRFHGCV